MDRIDPAATSIWIVCAAWVLFFWVYLVPVAIHAITRDDRPAACDALTGAECIAYAQEISH